MFNLSILKIKEFINEWDTKRGLFYNIHIFFITSSILVILISFDLISTSVAKYILLLPNFIFLTLWILRRSYLSLSFSKKLNVVFALNLEDKSKNTLKIYKEIIQELKMKILENNLEDSIEIREKPRDIKFKNKNAAEAKVQMGLPGSVLLIWGGITEGSQKYKLFFSYEFGYPGKKEEYFKAIFDKKVDKVLAKKLWSYNINSIEGLSQDFLEVIYYILALTMATVNSEKSVILSENFIKEWKKSNDFIKKRNLGPALVEIERILANIYLNYARLYYDEKNYDKIAVYAKKVLDINYDDKINYYAWLLLAIYYEEGMGDTINSKKCVEEARNIHPSRHEQYRFDDAYFAINDEDFKLFLEIYEELTKWDHDTNYSQIRDSLFRKYKKTENLGFFFAEIYIAYIFQGDKPYGKKKFKKFIKKAEKSKSNIDYSLLISKAKEILSNYFQKGSNIVP